MKKMPRLVVSVVFALGATAFPAVGQTEVFSFAPMPPGQGGAEVSSAGDFDADGLLDLLVAPRPFGSVVVRSGRDGTILTSVGGTGPLAIALGDVSGDGATDFLVGGRVDSVSCSQLRVYSGATQAFLYTVPSSCAEDLLSTDDLNGDGVRDFCVSDFSVRALSGDDGGLIWTEALPIGGQSRMDFLGADASGDGIPDVLVAGRSSSPGNSAFVRLLSGMDGTLVWEFVSAPLVDATDLAVVGDANGDGFPDVAVQYVGSVGLHDGTDGTQFRSYPTATNTARISVVGDLDGDGVLDTIHGEPSALDPFGLRTGSATAYSTRTGAPLWTVYGTVFGDGFGSSLAGMGDITADGFPEVAIGTARVHQTTSLTAGTVSVVSGVLLPHGLALPVGMGCGAASSGPNLASTAPRIGAVFTTFVTGARPNALAVLRYSPIPNSPTTLPSGCMLYLKPGSTFRYGIGVTSLSGTWVLNSPVPYHPSLIGIELALQATILGQPREFSNGLHLLLGL